MRSPGGAKTVFRNTLSADSIESRLIIYEVLVTVRRSDTATFGVPPDHTADIIRGVLAKNRPSYRYTNVVESPEHHWTARIMPDGWPLLLSTRIDVHCVGVDGGSRVTIRTLSQFFIMGDVFNFYRRYIRDVLAAIDEEARATM